MQRSVLDSSGPAVATAADMVAGHVTLDISCLDRIYLNGYVAKLQTSGGVVYFFNDHRGKRIVSPALFEPIGAKFRKDMSDWAQANGIPVIRFKAEERKADVVAPYLEAAAAAGRSQVAVIGCAQEFQRVWTARKHDTGPGRSPQFSFTKEQRRVSAPWSSAPVSAPARSSRRCCARTWTWAARKEPSCCSAAASGAGSPAARLATGSRPGPTSTAAWSP